jgi:hypothetical protein
VHIAVAGSSGLGLVIGVAAQPAALLTALPDPPSEHVLVLAPAHLERRAREQAHVVVAARPDVRVGVLAFDHHALALTLIAAAVLQLESAPSGWSEPGEAVQLVRQAAARSRSIVWHPRVLGLRRPVPSVAQSAVSLLRADGYFAEVGAGAGPVRGPGGFALDGEEALYVAGQVPDLLLRQLGETRLRVVEVTAEPSAPYRTLRSAELCGLAGPVWGPLVQRSCEVCSASRPLSGCLFCGTGSDARSGALAAAGVSG